MLTKEQVVENILADIRKGKYFGPVALGKAYDAGVESLDREGIVPQPKRVEGWIAMSERLPESGSRIIVSGTDTNGSKSTWSLEWDNLSDEFDTSWLKRWKVTHWMPLPQPPCEAEKDKPC